MSGLLDGSIPMGAVTDDTKKYDLNNDGKLDIVDIQMLMNLSIGLNADGSQKGSASRATAVTVEAPALLTVSCEEMGGVTRYALSLEDGRPFAAFQMDVVTTGSMQVVSEQAAFSDMSLFSGTLPSGTRRRRSTLPSLSVWPVMPPVSTSFVQPLPTVSTSALAASARMS